VPLYEDHDAFQVKGGQVQQITDPVCIEDTFRLYLNDIPLAQVIASPEQLPEFGAGFAICEGLTEEITDVRVVHNDIRVCAATSPRLDYELRSSGCIGVRGLPKAVSSSLAIDPSMVLQVIAQIESEAWRRTGGVHCSVLFHEGQVACSSSDIGRHNTIDKVVGHAVLRGIDRSRCVVGCTGRQPAGMITKIANAGIPIVVSKAAATDAGIRLADRSNVMLVCFARGNRFTVYTHPERLEGLGARSTVG